MRVNHDKKDIKNKPSNNRKTALCGVMIALAMVLSYLESLIPFNFAVPGIKLGLANMVTIIAMQRLGVKQACAISTGRIILSGILFGNIAVIIYSLAGAALSIAVMWLAGRIKVFSLVGISVCGAVSHNLGQLIVAALMMENTKILYYMLVLAITGTIAGIIIGIISSIIMKNIKFNI